MIVQFSPSPLSVPHCLRQKEEELLSLIYWKSEWEILPTLGAVYIYEHCLSTTFCVFLFFSIWITSYFCVPNHQDKFLVCGYLLGNKPISDPDLE